MIADIPRLSPSGKFMPQVVQYLGRAASGPDTVQLNGTQAEITHCLITVEQAAVVQFVATVALTAWPDGASTATLLLVVDGSLTPYRIVSATVAPTSNQYVLVTLAGLGLPLAAGTHRVAVWGNCTAGSVPAAARLELLALNQ